MAMVLSVVQIETSTSSSLESLMNFTWLLLVFIIEINAIILYQMDSQTFDWIQIRIELLQRLITTSIDLIKYALFRIQVFFTIFSPAFHRNHFLPQLLLFEEKNGGSKFII